MRVTDVHRVHSQSRRGPPSSSTPFLAAVHRVTAAGRRQSLAATHVLKCALGASLPAGNDTEPAVDFQNGRVHLLQIADTSLSSRLRTSSCTAASFQRCPAMTSPAGATHLEQSRTVSLHVSGWRSEFF